MVTARVLRASAAMLPPGAVVDTTGAGDSFIGTVLYGIATGMPHAQILQVNAKTGCFRWDLDPEPLCLVGIFLAARWRGGGLQVHGAWREGRPALPPSTVICTADTWSKAVTSILKFTLLVSTYDGPPDPSRQPILLPANKSMASADSRIFQII